MSSSIMDDIPKDSFDHFLRYYSGIPAITFQRFQAMAGSDTNQGLFKVWSDGSFKSTLSYIGRTRISPIASFFYVSYSLHLKLEYRQEELESPERFSCYKIGDEEVRVHGTKVDEMEAMKEIYLRYKALTELRSRGIIDDEITF